MFFRLLLLFTVVPLVELALLVQMGRLLGLAPTVALVVVTGALGAWLTRLQGLRVAATVQAELAAGRMPAGALVDGLLILIAGAVLLTPGLITDAVGFALLVPAVRRRVRSFLAERFRHRIEAPPPGVIDVPFDRED